MTPELADIAAFTLAGLTGAGLVQCAAGWAALSRFRARPTAGPRRLPPVTILKPLHGDEPLLEQALATACAQDYPDFQIVFGLQNPDDPALAVLARLRKRFPHVAMDVVVDRTQHGANRKIGNLVNMMPLARHDVLVIADSDMHVAPDYLRRLVAALEQPGVGLVTTVYSGLAADAGLVARLGAAQINHAFLPGALLARVLGRQDCLGATMALTRTMLDQVGGMRALVEHLADDAVLGSLVLAQGQRIALAGTVPATTVPETRMPALFEHELRWARTVKSLAPTGFVLSAVQYPLFWAGLTVAASGGAGWAWALFAGAWAVRAGLARLIERKLGLASAAGFWCLPLRDLLSMAVMFASYRTRRVAWRGQVMTASRPLSLRPGRPGSIRPGLAPGKG